MQSPPSQSCFFRKSPSCKSSCRKMDPNAQNIPVRGRFKWCQPLFARCLQCATWAFANRRQHRRRTMDRKYSPRYPERKYFAHLDGKSDNMPPQDLKRDARAKERRAANLDTHKISGTQTLRGIRRMDEIKPPSPVPKREMRQRDIRRQGSSRTATLWIS